MSHTKNKLSACANCGYKFNGPDNFCPECGQENHDIRLPVKHHIHEVIEGLLHLDSKSFRTFFYLVARPGMLSKEFSEGKRIRFVPPVRLYIFISFVFFFLMSTGRIVNTAHQSKTENDFKLSFSPGPDKLTPLEKETLSKERQDSLISFRSSISIREVAGFDDEQINSIIAEKRLSDNWLNRYVVRQMAKAGEDGSREFFHLMFKNFSYGMFLLMPFMGLIFYFFYRKTSKYYVEHLILSIHYHCVIFLLLSAVILINKFLAVDILYLIAALIIPAYLYLMLKKYYGQKTVATIVKTASIGIIHLISAGLFYFIVMIISLMLV